MRAYTRKQIYELQGGDADFAAKPFLFSLSDDPWDEESMDAHPIVGQSNFCIAPIPNNLFLLASDINWVKTPVVFFGFYLLEPHAIVTRRRTEENTI